MPRVTNGLSARAIETLQRAGRHSDGGGLYLFISEGGRRRWIFRYTRQGRTVEMGLGAAGKRGVSLAIARQLAANARAALAQQVDPLEAKRAATRASVAMPTFGEVADGYIELMRPSWRNAKHAWQWGQTLVSFAGPIRGLPVNEVETGAVLSVLKPIWEKKSETAQRLRGRIERILDHAKARGLRSGENPARWRGHLDQFLPKRQRLTRGHLPALPYDEVPAFGSKLRGRDATTARLLEFTILTAVRSGEARSTKWREINLEKAVWTVPAERMKGGREHRVPLSPRAIEIIDGMRGIGTGDYVFPASRGDRPMSNMAMLALLKRMGRSDITVHGFRSAFRDWAAETTEFPHEVCEMALAHAIANKVEAAYRRGDLFEKRRELMDAWMRYVTDNCVALSVDGSQEKR